MSLHSATRDAKVSISIMCPTTQASNLIASQLTNSSLILTLQSHKLTALQYQIITQSQTTKEIIIEVDYSSIDLVPTQVRKSDCLSLET